MTTETSQPSSESIHARIGGEASVNAAVEEFYKRVLADPLLAPYFEGIDMDDQRQKQFQFLTTAFGGPQIYGGRAMDKGHEHLAIEQRHFDAVAGHLVGTLQHLGVGEDLIGEIVELVGPLAAFIVNTPTEKEAAA